MKKNILIYEDEGVCPGSFQRIFSACRTFFPNYPIEPVHHGYFFTAKWEEKAALLIFPGGRDLAYQKRLKGEGNASIGSYVHKGGKYLGICAGGYYGSKEIEFEKGCPLQVCGLRELGFFPGKAVGPAYGKRLFRYENQGGARAAPIAWEQGISSVYFHGGCFFQDAEKFPNVEVLATYSDLPNQPAACILSQYGRGMALLTGVHPEYRPKDPLLPYLFNKILI
jgi:biotin---protein ligase